MMLRLLAQDDAQEKADGTASLYIDAAARRFAEKT
jgi:hypothetical protein